MYELRRKVASQRYVVATGSPPAHGIQISLHDISWDSALAYALAYQISDLSAAPSIFIACAVTLLHRMSGLSSTERNAIGELQDAVGRGKYFPKSPQRESSVL